MEIFLYSILTILIAFIVLNFKKKAINEGHSIPNPLSLHHLNDKSLVMRSVESKDLKKEFIECEKVISTRPEESE